MGVSATDSSTSYTNAAYSTNGIAGMASGIDTESVVQSMLSNIQNKIDKQNQKKQQLEWKQEMYRSVIDDINSFQSKYLNLTSSSCIRLSSFYDTMTTDVSSKAATVTAGSGAIDSKFEMQVAQLATNTSVTSAKVGTGDISTSTAKADSFEFDRTVKIKVGDGSEVEIDLKDATNDDIVSKINTAVGKNVVSMNDSVVCTDENGKTLTQKFTLDGAEYTGNVKIKTTTTYTDKDGNTLTYNKDDGKYYNADNTEYTGEASDIQSNTTAEYTDENGNKLDVKYYNSDDTEYTGDVKTSANVTHTLTFNADEEINISGSAAGMAILGLSGTSAKATAAKDEDGNEIADKFELKTSGFNEIYAQTGKVNGNVDITLDGVTKSFAIAEGEGMDDLAKKVQDAFGSSVNFNKNADGSWGVSVNGTGRQFKISANADTMKAIGFEEGTTAVSNQLLRTDTVAKLGIGTAGDSDTKYTFNINGKDIEYTAEDSVSSIMNKINSSGAGVSISYNELSDKFQITSTSTGEGFDIKLTGDDEGLFAKLGFNMNGEELDQSSVKAGQNAVVNIDGVTVERANNNFSYNGLEITVNKTTGTYAKDANGDFIENADGTMQSSGNEEKVSVSTSRNVDKIVDNLKAFVEDYNKLIEKLNGYTHDDASYKDYAPLTEAQKKEMTDKEIELWEEKAKEGLLRNDKEISSFLSDMRTALYSKGGGQYMLTHIGIDSSSQWSDYGKLSIDEDKLKSALQTNAEDVKAIFVGENGIATKLNKICNETANTSSGSKGSLVEIAGVKGKATEQDNTIKDQLDAIADKLESLNRIYEARKERYWNQFNAMETALANMNSQSDTLASYLGY